MKIRRSAPRQRGVSLIEVVISTAVASVLASVAVPNMVSVKDGAVISAATNELVSALHLARSEAAARRSRVVVSPADGAAWRTGWNVYVDRDDDGEFDPARDTLVRHFPARTDGVRITPHFGAASRGTALSYTADGVMRRPGSNGLLIGRLTIEQGRHVRSLCVATMRIRTVQSGTCS